MAFLITRFCRGADVRLRSKFVKCKDFGFATILRSTPEGEPSVSKHSESRKSDDQTFESMPSLPMRGTVPNDGLDVKKIPQNLRFQYPEFLPLPHIPWRNAIAEKLQRQDMLARRSQIHIPEFYVGCVMRVVKSNVHQHDKCSEFVGICIRRDGTGLKATFSLRNTIDNLGVEFNYELYDPTIQKIEVLRFEKRLDDDLGYLRDAYPEYCTFPLDMKPEVRRDDSVPVNPIKVKLKPRPWFFPWHKRDYKGIEDINSHLSKKMILKHKKHVKPWEKYDLMQEYRRTIPEEEQEEIYSEVIDDLERTEQLHAQSGRK